MHFTRVTCSIVQMLVIALWCLLPTQPAIASISAGDDFSCGVVDGGVRCWGSNAYGQLGNPAFGDVSVANDVATLAPGTNAGVTAVATGATHACAIVNGGVQCWGTNGHGQLGDGTKISRNAPVWAIPAGSSVTAISAGGVHTCAVVGGAAKCWGGNGNYQIGDGTTNDRTTPQGIISAGLNVTAIAAGTDHTCAVVGGGLRCWGNNTYGQLGDATTTQRITPATIFPSNSGISGVAAGDGVTCMVKNAQAKCWGYNGFGMLGDNSQVEQHDANLATSVIGLGTSVTRVAVGSYHICAISAGIAKCWGGNFSGQLGDGTITNRPAATAVTNLAGSLAADIAAGSNNSCVELLSGQWRCWGEKGHGKLGNRSDVRTLVPVGTATFAVQSAVLGALHGCALAQGGKVQCWGHNSRGQLGNGYGPDHPTPVDVSGIPSGATALAAGFDFNCAVVAGAVECWGSNASGELGSGSSGGTSGIPTVALGSDKIAIAVTAGTRHACAIAQAGVYCWGRNGDSQIGDPADATDHASPYLIPSLAGKSITSIVAGAFHTCAIVDGGVQCWGTNAERELGDPIDFSDHAIPYTAIPANSNVTAIAAGDSHTCAVVNGGVQCWGANYDGQLGNPSPSGTATPTQVTGLDPMYGVTNVVAGNSHTCALAFGYVFCWGKGYDGQLGIGTYDNWDSPINPVSLGYGSGETTTAITAGYSHTCAVTTGSGLKCWGDNVYASLGTGQLDYITTPAVVLTNDVIFANRFEVKP